MNSTILHFFSQYLKLYFWDISKQLKIILQWIAVREVYVSIFKVYLRAKTLARLCNSKYKHNRFLKEDPDTHAEPLRKNGLLETNPLQICRSWHTKEMEVLKLITPNQSSEIVAHRNRFVSPFIVASSIEKRAKKWWGRGKSYKERFSMLEWSWKKLDELFQSWKKSIHSCKLLCYRPNGRVTLVGAFKG